MLSHQDTLPAPAAHGLRNILQQMMQQKRLVALTCVALGLLFWMALEKNTAMVDWQATYYPATRALIHLQSPYEATSYFFAPFWSLIPVIPFALFPMYVAGALFLVASVLGFAYLGIKMKCSPIGLMALLLSAPVMNCVQTGNIEWIPYLGIFMPAPIGLVFLSMKPQSTMVIILLITWQVYRQDSFKGLVKMYLPTALLGLLSIALFGFWFLHAGDIFARAGTFLFTAWPYGIPFGLALLYLAFKRQRVDFALGASPLLSPYAILLTWSGFVMSFAKSTRWLVFVSVMSWVIWLIFRYYIFPTL